MMRSFYICSICADAISPVCFSPSLLGSHCGSDVIDSWGTAPAAVMQRARAAMHMNHFLGAAVGGGAKWNATSAGIVDATISHLVDDSVQVADKGKGHFLLAWSHYVQTKGHYPSVRSVILGCAFLSIAFAFQFPNSTSSPHVLPELPLLHYRSFPTLNAQCHSASIPLR